MSQDVVSAELQETPDPERPAEDVAVSMDLAMSAATAEAEPGERLKAARLGMGMSVSDVARQLKLRPRQVEALERGDHQALPGPVFVRGFARNYARLVGLDADTLAGAAARPEIPGSGAAEAGKGRAAVWTSGTQGPVFEEGAARARKSWWPVTVGLIIVAAVLLYLGRERLYPDTPGEAATVPAGDVMGEQTQGGASGADAGETTTGTPVDLAIAPPPVPAPARADVAPPGAGPSASGAIANPVPAPQGEDGVGRPPFPESAPAASTSGTALASRPGEVVTGAGPVLRLAFTQDSWVEVRDARGTTLLSRTVSPGEQVGLNGLPPLALVVGNAAATELVFRGRAVDLSARSRDNVARFQLP